MQGQEGARKRIAKKWQPQSGQSGPARAEYNSNEI